MHPKHLAEAVADVAAQLTAAGVIDVLGLEARLPYPHENSRAAVHVAVHTGGDVEDLADRLGVPGVGRPVGKGTWSREGDVLTLAADGAWIHVDVYGPKPVEVPA